MDGQSNDDPILPWYLTKIELEYARSISRGFVDPVMVVLDARSDRAKALAVEIFGEAKVAEQISDSEKAEAAPILISAWPRELAETKLSHLSGIEHMADFAASRLMTIFIWSHGTYRWVSAPRPNDMQQ